MVGEAEQIRDFAQNSERKVPDSLGCEVEGASSSCLSVVATAFLTHDDGDELAKYVNVEKIGFDNQIDSGIQATEQTECPDHDLVRNKGADAGDEEVAATRSALERQIDSDGEPKISVGEMTEGIRCMDPMDASSDSRAEDKLNEDIVDKKVEETFKVEEPAKEQQTLNGCVSKEDSELLTSKGSQSEKNGMQKVILPDIDKEEVNDAAGSQVFISSHENDGNGIPVETAANNTKDPSVVDPFETLTPNSHTGNAEDRNGETIKSAFTPTSLSLIVDDDDGTPDDQAAFLKEVESFYKGRAMDFKQPKFYGQPLNCLKLWRAVIRLGGYEKVTGSKLWRQVGESFHPPKTCTTVSWTFRIFYEKSLLEYEKHMIQSNKIQLPPLTALSEATGIDGEVSGPGRARRDSAARAMPGWHVQRLFPGGEVGEPMAKDKNTGNSVKREKTVKNPGSLKQKRTPELEYPNKVTRTEMKRVVVPSIVDVGTPAEWVKINVLRTEDCFEVYALVPGLLRDEVRVQSDPAGRVVVTGQPGNLDNPWGITPFKKVITLPERIDALQTSAVVSMHGRLFVRVPFE